MTLGGRFLFLLGPTGLGSFFGDLPSASVGEGFQTPLPADQAAFAAHLGHNLRDEGAGGFGRFFGRFGLSDRLQYDAPGILDRVKSLASALWHGFRVSWPFGLVKLDRPSNFFKLTHYHNTQVGATVWVTEHGGISAHPPDTLSARQRYDAMMQEQVRHMADTIDKQLAEDPTWKL